MATAQKKFKIGEYAIGGIIQVQIAGKVILIKALDWETNKEVLTGSVLTTDLNSYSKASDFLNELTSYYYAEKVLDWIKTKTKLS